MGRRPIEPDEVKTTLDLDDDLLRRAKRAALERDTTLRAIVEEALARSLGPQSAPVPLRTLVWPPVDAGAAAAPPEDERDWLARIKAVRYGDDVPGAGSAPTARGRARPAKARAR